MASFSATINKIKYNKINKVQFYKIWKEGPFWTLKKLSSWQAEKDAVKQKVISFKDDGQKSKMVVKIEFTPLPPCNILPFFKGFKIGALKMSALNRGHTLHSIVLHKT